MLVATLNLTPYIHGVCTFHIYDRYNKYLFIDKKNIRFKHVANKLKLYIYIYTHVVYAIVCVCVCVCLFVLVAEINSYIKK